jgi:hypothetical protein
MLLSYECGTANADLDDGRKGTQWITQMLQASESGALRSGVRCAETAPNDGKEFHTKRAPIREVANE